MRAFWTSVEATALASTIHDSFALTATLSALHALGFTLIMSGSLLANLRCAGLLFAGRSVREVARPGMNAMVVLHVSSASTVRRETS